MRTESLKKIYFQNISPASYTWGKPLSTTGTSYVLVDNLSPTNITGSILSKTLDYISGSTSSWAGIETLSVGKVFSMYVINSLERRFGVPEGNVKCVISGTISSENTTGSCILSHVSACLGYMSASLVFTTQSIGVCQVELTSSTTVKDLPFAVQVFIPVTSSFEVPINNVLAVQVKAYLRASGGTGSMNLYHYRGAGNSYLEIYI